MSQCGSASGESAVAAASEAHDPSKVGDIDGDGRSLSSESACHHRTSKAGRGVGSTTSGNRRGDAPITSAYLNWGPCQAWWWGVVVVGAGLVGSVDARAYLGPRPGGR